MDPFSSQINFIHAASAIYKDLKFNTLLDRPSDCIVASVEILIFRVKVMILAGKITARFD